MRKIILLSIVFLMLVVPIASAMEILSNDNSMKNNEKQSLSQDFTHSVLVEYGSLTTCPPCVTANAQLKSIYNSDDYDFNYVTLVWDKGNARVRARLQELTINNVPDVYFDGKYSNIIGGQTNEIPYINEIVQAGERDVPDLDIDLDVVWVGNGILKISGIVNNNEPEPYNGIIRTYIVEKESRWNDNGGNPYHFAVLDIPIDKSVNIVSKQIKPIEETYTFEKTWVGLLRGFVNIKKENIMVIATVFDAETDHAIETAVGEPTSQSTTQEIPLLIQRFISRFPIFQQIIYNLLIK